MSALGHKQTCAVQNAMSALPPIADMCSAPAHVRFVPIADYFSTHSFYHFVGTVLNRLRHGDAQRFRGLEVDDQLDFHRLLNRQIGGPLSLENPARVDPDLTGRFSEAAAVAHKAASGGELTKLGDRRHRVTSRQCTELFVPADEECIWSDHERTNSQLRQRSENRIEVTLSAGMKNMELQPEGAGS